MQGTIGLHCKEGLCEETTMQQPIATNDVNLFSVLKENQYFDRKSARKDDREIAKHISAFANAAGSLATTKKGGVASAPALAEIGRCLTDYNTIDFY